ncbi:ABC transporter permease [Nocardioides mangrovi]|uniref:ABC transporter permease n=1 Tax=Nocardioides mangrovi TaxID=2874580 RepID=A0ABS7UFT0_9ACTN|nr:ABC transporter permease [Nocardioides mangrovi]MBZ5739551.1 ABC transporter permease [Nocardioides mangrovi]
MTTLVDTTPDPAAAPKRARRPTRSGHARRLALQTAFVLAILAAWSVARMADVMTVDALPAPWSVAERLVEDVQTADYWTTLLDTLRSAVGGLVAAALVGIPLGLVTGTYAWAERSTRVLVEFGRSFPVIAILPVMLLVMGTSFMMKGVVVFLACVFPLIIQAQYGAQSVSESVDETVRSYRIGRLLRFRKVVLPAASPSVWTGLRIAATMAVLVSIGVEILTTVPGVGHVIVTSQQDQNSANAYAYILTAGLLGFIVTRLVQLAEARALAWRPPTTLEN